MPGWFGARDTASKINLLQGIVPLSFLGYFALIDPSRPQLLHVFFPIFCPCQLRTESDDSRWLSDKEDTGGPGSLQNTGIHKYLPDCNAGNRKVPIYSFPRRLFCSLVYIVVGSVF